MDYQEWILSKPWRHGHVNNSVVCDYQTERDNVGYGDYGGLRVLEGCAPSTRDHIIGLHNATVEGGWPAVWAERNRLRYELAKMTAERDRWRQSSSEWEKRQAAALAELEKAKTERGCWQGEAERLKCLLEATQTDMRVEAARVADNLTTADAEAERDKAVAEREDYKGLATHYRLEAEEWRRKAEHWERLHDKQRAGQSPLRDQRAMAVLPNFLTSAPFILPDESADPYQQDGARKVVSRAVRKAYLVADLIEEVSSGGVR